MSILSHSEMILKDMAGKWLFYVCSCSLFNSWSLI